MVLRRITNGRFERRATSDPYLLAVWCGVLPATGADTYWDLAIRKANLYAPYPWPHTHIFRLYSRSVEITTENFLQFLDLGGLVANWHSDEVAIRVGQTLARVLNKMPLSQEILRISEAEQIAILKNRSSNCATFWGALLDSLIDVIRERYNDA